MPVFSWKKFAVMLGASLLATACIVVPAENHYAPPPQGAEPLPPPPPYAEQQAPPEQQPPAQGYAYPDQAQVVVYYEEPAPEPVAYYEPSVIWYYGPHSVTPGYGMGWCSMRGAHTHNYEPYWNDRYEFYSGYYYYVGDPSPYDRSAVYFIYVGAHTNPWGGWCYATGEHRHYYGPRRQDSYRHEHGMFYFSGSYDSSYYSNRGHYDSNGHRNSGNAYVEHRSYSQTHSTPISATHETTRGGNGHETGRGDVRRDDRRDERHDERNGSAPVPMGQGAHFGAPQMQPAQRPTPAPAAAPVNVLRGEGHRPPAAPPTPAPRVEPPRVERRPAPTPTPTPTPRRPLNLGGH